MPITRRTLLDAMVRLGGAGAAHESTAASDFFRAPPAAPSLDPNAKNQRDALTVRRRWYHRSD